MKIVLNEQWTIHSSDIYTIRTRWSGCTILTIVPSAQCANWINEHVDLNEQSEHDEQMP